MNYLIMKVIHPRAMEGSGAENKLNTKTHSLGINEVKNIESVLQEESEEQVLSLQSPQISNKFEENKEKGNMENEDSSFPSSSEQSSKNNIELEESKKSSGDSVSNSQE
jgi:hypothetical protein